MRIGGPGNVTDAIKANGGEVGPRTTWVTAGVENWGLGYLDSFFADCKRDGMDPLVKLWVWGDMISTPAIQDGVDDKYQRNKDGSPIHITREKAYAWARTMAEKATAAGVAPHVVIEHEFGKNGVDKDRTAFGPYFSRVADIIITACPDARIVFCSAIWNDQAVIARNYAMQIGKADVLGLQTLLFAPRHPEDQFRNAGKNLAKAFDVLRQATPEKPAAIIDLGFSSYGGAYAKAHPFAGGDGRAHEDLQATAVRSMTDVPGLEFIAYRNLKDLPGFSVSNFGGHAERHLGVVRSDGSKKPAYAALMDLARPKADAWMEAPVARVEALEAALEAQAAQLAAMGSRLDAAAQALGPRRS